MRPTKSVLSPPIATKRRRRLATCIAIGTMTAGLGIAVASPASASGSASTTISSWSSADFAPNDGKDTKLTVAAGVDTVGVIGSSLKTTKTVSVKLAQSYCTTSGGRDILITRSLSKEAPVSSGVQINTLLGSASVNASVALSGTQTSTPAGSGGKCTTPNPAGATTTPATETVSINVTWKNAPNSSPIVWTDVYQGAAYYYRDAAATGSLGSTKLTSTSGWLWAGAWVYPTGT